MKKSVFKTVFKFYKNYHWTHFDYTSWEAHMQHEKELETYDPVKKQEIFEAMLKELEKKLTKAKQKGETKKVKALEEKVDLIISGRLQEYSFFDRQGFGRLGCFASCKHSIKYNENGEATISVEFKDEEIVPLTGAELRKILNGKSLNYNPSTEQSEEKEVVKVDEKKKTTKSGIEVIKPANKEQDQNIEKEP